MGFTAYRATDRFIYWRFDANADKTAGQRRLTEDDTSGDTFDLYDIRVIVEEISGNCTCNMRVGYCFYLRHSSSLSLPDGGHFCIWALNSVLPPLSAKQRHNHPADWIETDSRLLP
ncbi:MAG: TIGR04076 family protein [Caldilineaceae bacterium]